MSLEKSVLIVEDDVDILEMLRLLLSLHGYRVLIAVTRDEAAPILDVETFDTILLDYMMPGQSAAKFVEAVRRKYPKTDIVLMTARDHADSTARVLGIKKVLKKPFDEQQLLAVLR